ncbi:MAG: Rrf2 family transcriptional regulator [Gemmataceae bacterium]
MALLTRKVDYAILVLSFLHRKSEGGCAREMADKFGLSRAFVANILKELCQKGFVTSHRGVKGGYVMARPVEGVTLAEFIEALDDHPFQLAACNQGTPGDGCSLFIGCPVREPVAEIHRRLRAVLNGVTLAELFGPAGIAERELLTLGV